MAEDEKAERLTLLANGEAEAALRSSIAGRIGHAMEPILKPMGFDWRIGTALIGAFAAKEVFVAQKCRVWLFRRLSQLRLQGF